MNTQWIIEGGTAVFAAINGTQLGTFAQHARAARQGAGASPSRRAQAKATFGALLILSFLATGLGFAALSLAPGQNGALLAGLMLAAVAPQWYFSRATRHALVWMTRPSAVGSSNNRAENEQTEQEQ